MSYSKHILKLYGKLPVSYGTTAMIIGRYGCNKSVFEKELGHRSKIWHDRKTNTFIITSTAPIEALIMAFKKICDFAPKNLNIRYEQGDELTSEEINFWSSWTDCKYPSYDIYVIEDGHEYYLHPGDYHNFITDNQYEYLLDAEKKDVAYEILIKNLSGQIILATSFKFVPQICQLLDKLGYHSTTYSNYYFVNLDDPDSQNSNVDDDALHRLLSGNNRGELLLLSRSPLLQKAVRKIRNKSISYNKLKKQFRYDDEVIRAAAKVCFSHSQITDYGLEFLLDTFLETFAKVPKEKQTLFVDELECVAWSNIQEHQQGIHLSNDPSISNIDTILELLPESLTIR